MSLLMRFLVFVSIIYKNIMISSKKLSMHLNLLSTKLNKIVQKFETEQLL